MAGKTTGTQTKSKDQSKIQNIFETEAGFLAEKSGNVLGTADILRQFIFVDPVGKPLFDSKGQLDPKTKQFNQTRLTNFRRAQKEIPLNSVFSLYRLEQSHAALDLRLAAFDQIFDNTNAPFETLDETKLEIKWLLRYLERNKDSLLEIGFPKTPHWNSSPWWDGFTKIYPTELPSSRTIKIDKDGLEYDYRWEKSEEGANPFALSKNNKKAIKEGRRAAYEIAIRALNDILKAIETKTASGLARGVLKSIGAIEEAKALLQVDVKINNDKEAKGLQTIPSFGTNAQPDNFLTLTKLIELAFHIESEIRYSTISNVKQSLIDLFPKVASSPHGISYFRLATTPQKEKLNNVIDLYISSFKKAGSLAEELIEPEKVTKTDLLGRFQEQQRDKYQELIENPIVKEWLLSIANKFGIESISKISISDLEDIVSQNIFRKVSKDVWEIRFQDKKIFVRNSVGMEHLHKVLFAKPGYVHFEDLAGPKNGPDQAKQKKADSADESPELDDTSKEETGSQYFQEKMNIRKSTRAIYEPALDKKGLKKVLDFKEALEAKRNRTPKEDDDLAMCKDLLRIRNASDEIVRTKSGKLAAKRKDADEKTRKTVNKAFTDAIKVIAREDPEIGKHFKKAIQSSSGHWIYNTYPDYEWLT